MPDGRGVLCQALGRASRPTGLLVLVGQNRGRQLGRGDHVIGEVEAPAAQDGAGTEAQVFAECVRLPAAGVFDARPPPDTGRAVELGKAGGTMAHDLFDGEVLVQSDGLRSGQRRVGGVEMPPTGLNRA